MSPIIWNLVFEELLISLNTQTGVQCSGFADDGGAAIRGSSTEMLKERAQKVIDTALEWAKRHKLTLNPKKTELVLFNKGDEHCPKLIMGGESLRASSTTRFLGVILDKYLTFTPHVDKIVASTKYKLMVANKLISSSVGPSPKFSILAYKSLIRPIISYGCHIWHHRVNHRHWVKLTRLQRLGLLTAMPSFPGTPTAGLEIMTDTLPIRLYLEKTSVATLVRTNPERLGRTFASKKDHISYLRKKATEIGINREKVDRNRAHILNRNFVTKTECGNPTGTGWEIFTDGSKMGEKVGFGVSIRENGNEVASFSEPLDSDNTVYLAEVRAINCATSWCFKNRQKIGVRPIRIFTDSLSSIYALRACVIKNFLVRDTIFKLNSLTRTNRVEIIWTRAHVGTEGNERADELAKQGAQSTAPPRYQTKISMKVVKTKIEAYFMAEWKKSWKNLGPCRQTRFWWPRPNAQKSKYLLSLPRPTVARLVQAITGFNNLSYHCYNMEYSDLSVCRLCWNGREEFIHLADECPDLFPEREEWFGIWGPSREWTIEGLIGFLGNPKVEYLMSTRPGEEEY